MRHTHTIHVHPRNRNTKTASRCSLIRGKYAPVFKSVIGVFLLYILPLITWAQNPTPGDLCQGAGYDITFTLPSGQMYNANNEFIAEIGTLAGSTFTALGTQSATTGIGRLKHATALTSTGTIVVKVTIPYDLPGSGPYYIRYRTTSPVTTDMAPLGPFTVPRLRPFTDPTSDTANCSGSVSFNVSGIGSNSVQWQKFCFAPTPYIQVVTEGLGTVPFVNDIARSGSKVFAATSDGVARSDNGGTSFNLSKVLSGNNANQVFISSSSVYVATSNGLFVSSDGLTGANYGSALNSGSPANLPSSFVNRVAVLSDGTIFAATAGGLAKSATGGGTPFTTILNDASFDVFIEDDHLYVATTTGLKISYDGGSTFFTYNSSNGLSSNNVQCVFVKDNIIYAGTDAGLSVSTNGGFSFTTVTKGLAANSVKRLYVDSTSMIYVATAGGLAIANASLSAFNNIIAGLPNTNVTCVSVSGNQLLIGLLQGVGRATINLSNEATTATFSPTITGANSLCRFQAVISDATSGCSVTSNLVNYADLPPTPAKLDSVTVTNAVSTGSTITVLSTSGLSVGMPVRVASGTGEFAAGTTVSVVNSATQFTVNTAPTTALVGASIKAAATYPPLRCGGNTGRITVKDLVPNTKYRLSLSGATTSSTSPKSGDTITTDANGRLAINFIASGIYWVRFNSLTATGCSSDSTMIDLSILSNVANPPMATIATVCEGSNIQVVLDSAAGPNEEFRWYKNMAATMPMSPSTSTGTTYSPNTAPTASGSIYVLRRNKLTQCVSSIKQINYTIQAKPVITASANPANNAITVALTNPSGSGTYNLSYKNASGALVSINSLSSGSFPYTIGPGLPVGNYSQIKVEQISGSLTCTSNVVGSVSLFPPANPDIPGKKKLETTACFQAEAGGYLQQVVGSGPVGNDFVPGREISVGRIRQSQALPASADSIEMHGWLKFNLSNNIPRQAIIDEVKYQPVSTTGPFQTLGDVDVRSPAGDIQFDVTQIESGSYGQFYGYSSGVFDDLREPKYNTFIIRRDQTGALTDLGVIGVDDVQTRSVEQNDADRFFLLGLHLSGSDFDLTLLQFHGMVFADYTAHKLCVTYHLEDYGDLPEPKYASDISGGLIGPSHRIDPIDINTDPATTLLSPGLYIGSAAPDPEFNGQASSTASGDDNNLSDDEDVAFPGPLFAGEMATLNVPVTNNMLKGAVVNLFIDWNGDGVFVNATERYSLAVQAAATPSSPGVVAPFTTSLTFNMLVPAILRTDSIAVRVRVTTGAVIDAYGPAPDGEVEDFFVLVYALDYGDLPDITSKDSLLTTGATNDFRVLRANNGPRHALPIIPLVYLGDNIDSEANGQPSTEGFGDDNAPLQKDDEDGVVFLTPMIPGQSAQLAFYGNNASASEAHLRIWADWNNDGTLEPLTVVNSNDLILSPATLISKTSKRIITFQVPSTATMLGGKVHFRFRLSSDAAFKASPSPLGLVQNGEVEDYVVPLFKIGNLVWEDRNHNGLQDAEESNLGIPNIRMIMRFGGIESGSGTCDSVSQRTVSNPKTLTTDFTSIGRIGDVIQDFVFETFTDSLGEYYFTGMIEGLYQIIAVDTFNLTPTRPDWIRHVSEEDRDSDASPLKQPWEYADTDVRQSKSQEWKLQTASVGINEQGILDKRNPLLPDPNERGTVFPDNRVEQRVDFGFVALDFGDLPNTYLSVEDGTGVGVNLGGLFPTASRLVGNPEEGPKHVVTPNLYLGTCSDAELEGQPDSDAGQEFASVDGLGDDPNNSPWDSNRPQHSCLDDDNGILFLTPLVPGYEAIITLDFQAKVNNDGPDAFLQAFFDWNGDGDFYVNGIPSQGFDPNEQILFTKLNGLVAPLDPDTKALMLDMSQKLVNEPLRLAFNVPANASFFDGNLLARFRIALEPNIGPTGILPANTNFPDGIVPYGEVEDYFMKLVRIGNFVWEDRNYNGKQDISEPVIAGVPIKLDYHGTTPALDGDAFEKVYMDTTDSNGTYVFYGLIGTNNPSGSSNPTYTLEAKDPDGMTPTIDSMAIASGALSNCLRTNSDGGDVTLEDGFTSVTFRIDNPMLQCTGELHPNGRADSTAYVMGGGGPNNPSNIWPDAQTDETFDFGFGDFDGVLNNRPLPNGQSGDTVSHIIQPRLYLGNGVRPITNPSPFPSSPVAEINSNNGVLLLSPLLPGEKAFIKVKYISQDTAMGGGYANKTAYLDAFADWNGNGNYDMPDEKIAFTHQLTSNVAFSTNFVPTLPSPISTVPMPATGTFGIDSTILAFDVPPSALFDSGTVNLRFRFGWIDYGAAYPDSFPYGLGPNNQIFHIATPPYINSDFPYPLGEVEDYHIPLARIGNLSWFDHDVRGDQDANEDVLDNLHLVLVWGGINPSSGKPDTVGYQTTLASAGSVTDILYNKTSVPPQVGSYLPNGGIQLTGNGQGSGRYSFRGLIPGHYYLIPQKYLIPDSAQSVLHWPPFRVLTLQDNPGTPDVLDSDGRVGSSTGPRGPGALLQIADSNPLFPEVAVADRPLNENSPLADSLESGLPFFPDNQWDQTIDLGWVDLPNVEANLDIVGVDFPASETCGNFNVKMDLCVKNPTEVPLDSFMITLDLARAYGDAFVGFLGTSIVDSAYSVETRDIKRPKSMFGAKDALTPFLNPGYNGDTDINLFRPQGSGGQRWNDVLGQGAFFLPGDSVFCVRVIFEVDSRKEVTFRSNTPKGWYSQGRVTARAVGFENGTGAKRAVQDLRLFDPRNPSAPNPNLGSPIVVEDLTDEIDDPKYKRTIPHPDAGDNVAFEGSVADRTYDPRLKNKYEDGDNKTIQNDSCWIRTAVSAAYQNINLVMDSKCESLLPLDKVLPGTFADCGFDRYPEGSYYRMIIQDEDTGETIWTSNSRLPFDAIKYFGRRLSYKLRNVVKSCELAWGRLTLEDKTKPIPICPISPANRRVDTSNLAFVPNALPFVCTDVDKVLRVERSWKDPAYEYFTGLATAVDSCGEVFLEKVSDQLLLYPECSASMANQYVFAKILRTFFFTDSYGNEDTCIQTILFARPKIVLPACKILVSNAVAKGDSTLNPSDLIRKYNLPESVPYFLDGAGRRHYLTEEKALCLFEISYTDENVYGIGGCGRKIVRRWILQDFCWTPSPAYPDYLTLPTSDSSCYAGKSWAKNRYEWEQYLVIGDETKPLVYVPDFDRDGFKGSGYPASLPNFLHPTSVATSSYDPGDFLLLGTNASECKGNLKFTRDMLIVLGETSWCFDIRLVARKPVLDLDEQPTGRFKLVAEPGVSIFGNCTSGFDIIGVPVPRDTNTSYFIEARVFDACGRDSTVFVPLRIADLTAPVVKCRDELRLSLDNTGRANASVANLHVGSWDNCGNVAWTKIRRPVENCTSEWMQINGFVDSNKNAKIDPDIDYIDENKNQRPEEWEYFRLNRVNGKLMSPLLDRLSFFCCDQDTVLVEIFTEDRAGNRDYCSSRVILEDKAPIQYVLPAPRTLFCTEAKSDLDNIPGSGEFAETTPAYRALTNILKSDILVLRNEQCRPIQKSVLVEYDMYCESGSIKVSWKLVNKSGSYVQTVVTQPVGISVLPSYEYNLTFPPDATGNCKILTDTANVADGGELSCSKLSVSVQDKRYLATSLQINNPSCYKVFRTYVASDECASSNECGEPAKWAVIVPRDPDGNGPDGVNVLVRDRFKGVENPQIPGTGLSGAPGSDGWEEIYFEDFCGKGKNYTGEACESVLAQGPRSDTGRFMSYVNPQGPCPGSNMAREHMAWLFTQILEVRDTTPPVVSGPNRLSFGLSKDNCRADVHITFSGQDDCSLISGISSDSSQSGRMYVHQVELVSGLSAPLSLGNLPIEMGAALTSSDTLGNTWSFSASLEEGEYSLIVTLRDGCGNISRRHPFTFQVVDTSAPTPLCFNGFSIALGSKANLTGGEATFWATDLMVRPVGDCNGQSDSVLVDGKKRVDLYYVAKDLNGDGVFDAQDSLNAKGFPLLPAKKATLVCEDLQGDSTHLVKIRLYSMDNRGNWAWCESFVQVSDPLSLCSRKTNTANIFGAISTESGIFVPGVAVDLTGISSSTFVTGKDGQFQFSRIEAGRDVSVSALLDKNHAEGVSTFDLFLLNRHIIGTKLLETPLQMIAADVNNSKSITVMDLVQLRKLVLGMADRFEGNTSWRFLDAAYVFTDTASVLEKQYPEVLNFNNVSGSLKADFRAVKIGDINGSALKESPQVRSAKGFQMDVPDAQMTKGQEYTIAFSMRQLNSFVGYQFTLAWNTQLVAFIEVLPNLSSKDNFGFFIPEGLLTTTYFAEKAHEGDTLFRIRVKALSNCRSSEVFSVNSRITSAEAYQISGEPVPVTLDFVPDIPKKQGFTLLQNTPNPFRTETQIPFILPEACEATIVVQDISGKVLATFNGRFAKGLNTVVWHSENRKASGISGVFFYTLTTDGFSETRKMIRIE